MVLPTTRLNLIKTSKGILFIFLCCLLSTDAIAQQVYQSKNGLAEFTSEVPLHTFTGSSKHLVGRINLADSTVDFYLDLNTLDTGNNKRDKDMRETLEADKFPFAEFYGKLVTGFNANSSQPQTVKVRGQFKIHKVQKELQVEGSLHKTEEDLRVEAEWTLDMTDYNIRPPGILFYRVDKKIDIHIQTTLKPISNQNSN